MEFFKKNFALILAFVLPVALITIVALSVYLPSFFLKTDYDFLYLTCADTNTVNCDGFKKRYSVVNEKLFDNFVGPNQDLNGNGIPDMSENYGVHFFVHDTYKNESKEITLEDARKLSLNGLLTSPDGVTVSSDYDRGAEFFPFFDGRSSFGYYLTKGRSNKRLNLINSDDRYYYRDRFQFIGWILEKDSQK